MSEVVSARGVLFAHGTMAEGMVDAVRCITGFGRDVLVSISNEGRSADSLLDEIEELADGRPLIVFTDLFGGSCATTARLSTRKHPDRAVICGANLPMLLDFVFHHELPFGELVDRLVSTGREGVQHLSSVE